MDYELKRNGSGYYDPTAYKAMTNLIKGEGTMEMKRGEIFEYNMQNGELKYVLVISSDERKSDRFLSIIVLSNEPKGRINAPVVCKKQMYADCCMVSYGYSDRFGCYVRTATEREMQEVEAGIMEALDIKATASNDAFEDTTYCLMRELEGKLEEANRQIVEGHEHVERLLAENERLRNAEPANDPAEVVKLMTERDTYKHLYEQMLERFIGK